MRKYLPYGDSPTIKSYTRWERFDEALRTVGEAVVEGAEEYRTSPFEDDLWWSKIHFERAKGYRAASKEVKVMSAGSLGFVHIEVPVDGRVLIVEDSSRGPLSVSGKIEGKGEVLHIVRGRNPHFSLWEVKGDITVRTYVEGLDAFLRYRGSGELQLYGVSRGARSDVFHVLRSEGTSVINRHLLIGEEGSFLVHRPVAKVFRGGEAFVETLLVKRGGFVVGVPSVEVYSAEVLGARHAVKDLVPSEEQMFYLRSRGFTPEEGKEYLVGEVIRFLLGDLLEVGVALP